MDKGRADELTYMTNLIVDISKLFERTLKRLLDYISGEMNES
jgi:hypothetical protein